MSPTAYLGNNWALLLCVGFCSCTAEQDRLPYYNTPDFTPVFTRHADSIPHQIADFSFTDQDGKPISAQDLDGKIHVANFFFTSCGSICPAMTNNLKVASEHFGKDSDVVFLSFSVTPWIDSVQTLAAYKRHNGITNPNWHFLTGDKGAIYQLARTSYFAEEELGFTRDSAEFLHTEHILLVDKTRRIRGIYNGTLKPDIENLITDIERLSKE